MGAPKGNKFAIGNNGGRPPLFENIGQLEEKCNDYFNRCDEEKEKATITGLALFLGFADRCSLYDYADKKEFSYVIKRARLAVENSYETSGKTIDIFALKQMGWEDKQTIDHSGEINNKPDLSNLSNEEVKQYGALNKKAKGL